MQECRRRAVVVSSIFKQAAVLQKMGNAAYSYHFVFRAFRSMLERWGQVSEVTHPESRLDFALYQARRAGCEPLHLSFLPFQFTYLTRRAPNVIFPFWEFPDVPADDAEFNSRNNWVRIANRFNQVLTASSGTRDDLLRAGVRTPIHVVPVPIRDEFFTVPAWRLGQEVVLECPCYLFPQPMPQAPVFNPYVAYEPYRFDRKGRLRAAYKFRIRPRLPAWFDTALTKVGRYLVTGKWDNPNPNVPYSGPLPYPFHAQLPLSGVVYTAIFNPFDPRKNWEDLLSAYLAALRDCDDATLVVKLATNEQLAGRAFRRIFWWYRQLPQNHKCKLAIVAALLSESQMTELARASTYYVNTAHAEGACLPLQEFLAAGRPGLAPVHTAMAEYFDDTVGLVVRSSPEPAAIPHARSRVRQTRWHRMDWQSLYDQFQTSYQMAKEERTAYQALAQRGRTRLRDFAGAARVWPRLLAALQEVEGHQPAAATRLRQAS